MNYKEIRNTLEHMANENQEDFVKALISFEKGINDKDALDKLYQEYMDNDSMSLLNNEFDYLIDELRENGQIKDSLEIEKEDNDLVNIVGNIVGEVEAIERENKNGEAFKVINFSVVSKGDEEIRFTLIAQLMGIREIFQKTLSKEILLKSSDKLKQALITTERNIRMSVFCLLSS